MKSYDIRDYLKIYDNFLDQNLCKHTVESLKNVEWNKHRYYTPHTDQYHSYENDLAISYDIIPEKDTITKQIWSGIEQYIVKDHAHFSEWYSGWNGYTEVRFNKYDQNTEMKMHCDHIHSIFDGTIKGIPILTILGLLNDDFGGGDLTLWEDTKIDMKPGTLLIFPSNFLYPHKVSPIIHGTRYSFVSWVY